MSIRFECFVAICNDSYKNNAKQADIKEELYMFQIATYFIAICNMLFIFKRISFKFSIK